MKRLKGTELKQVAGGEVTTIDKGPLNTENGCFDVEAGPIWNQAHAAQVGPEIARLFSEKWGTEYEWTGHWTTTEWGKMSVCNLRPKK